MGQAFLLCLVVWTPGVQSFFGTAAPPAIALVPCLFFGATLLTTSEIIKAVRRKDPKALSFLVY